ncbi:MAG: hypothetical protein FJ291_23540 [Planctomycetes bacterium]|nr:hypothetical protein [Planctomycetota bacterium]
MEMLAGLLTMLLVSGGGNDLLDYVQTKAYWQLKGVNVTVAAMTGELGPAKAEGGEAAEPKAAPRAAAVRRLMAIRTLGELKDAQALPALQPLLKSTALFEADYAQQAIAAIEGKPFERPRASARQMAGDPWLLPADCGIVGQVSMAPGKPLDIEKALKELAPGLPEQDPNALLPEVTNQLVSAAEQVGNVRLEGVTLGISGEVGDDKGFVVMIARGQYDAKRVAALLHETGDYKAEKSDGLEVFRGEEEEPNLIVVSNDCLVLFAGAEAEKLPVAATVAALKKGSGALTPESALGKLIKAADTAQPLWAVVKMTPTYREGGPMLAPFDSMSLVGRAAKDAQTLELVAMGTDAQKVAAAVAELEKSVKEGREEMAKVAGQMPMLQPAVDFLGSVKAKADGAKATVTASLKGASLVVAMPFWLFTTALGRAAAPEHREGPAPKADDF